MANEYTLADYEMLAPDPLSKAVLRTWREASPIMDMLRFKVDPALSHTFKRYGALPTVPWRKIGEAFTQVKIDPDEVGERLYFLGAKVDVPYELVKAPSIVDQRAIQTEAMMKSIAFGFNTAFFRNTPLDDEDAIVGMWYRIHQDLPAEQKFSAGLDVSPDTAVTSWQHKMFDVVDDLLSRVDGNPGDKVLAMGWTLYKRFQAAMRSSNLLATTTDQLGRQFVTYGQGGPKLLYVGKQVDQSTEILTDVETANTSLTSGAVSSMYCLRFGEPYIAGWMQESPSSTDVGLTEDQLLYRTVVRGSAGIYMLSPRSAAVSYSWTAA